MTTGENNGARLQQAGYPFALIEEGELKPHERVETPHLESLIKDISSDGVLRCPVLVDRHSLVILDGHHRVSALRCLGCRLIPAYLVDYSDPSIAVTRWKEDICMEVSKKTVVEAGLTGSLYPPKTSRHCWPCQPAEHPVSIEALRQLAGA